VNIILTRNYSKSGIHNLLDTVLQQLLAPSIMALGYELLGIERLPQGRRGVLLRLYIDSPEGITLADCEQVSYQVSGILEVEEPIRGAYTLEVSSPGLDRPLFTLAHFERFIGHQVTVKLTQPLDARRAFTGKLLQIDGRYLMIEVDGTTYRLLYDQVDKARLVPSHTQE